MKPRDFFIPQYTMETCGISCLQMALRYFNADASKPRNVYEKRLRQELMYKQYGLQPAADTPHLAGTMGSAIAYALFQRGLHVTLAHASPNMIENHGNYFDVRHFHAFRMAHLRYIVKAEQLMVQYAQAALENGSLHLQPRGSFTVERGVSVACDRLRAELERGRLVIVQIMVDGDADGLHNQVMHWILLYGVTEDGFLKLDPLSGSGIYSADELSARMHTPFGGTFITVGRDK